MDSVIYRRYTTLGAFFLFAVFLAQPVLAPFLESKGFSKSELSLMFMLFPLAVILLAPYFGKLADVVSRRFVIWIGLAAEALAMLIYIFASQFWLFAAARFLEAFAVSIVQVIVIAKVEDGIDKEKRGEQTGWSLSIGYMGKLLAPLVGGFVAQQFFPELTFTIVIAMLLVVSLLLHKKDGKKIAQRKRDYSFVWWSGLKEFLKHRQLLGMGIMGFVTAAAFGPFLSIFLPLIVVDDFGLSYQAVGWIMFFWYVPHIFQGYIGKLADMAGAWRGVVVGVVGLAIILFFIPFAHSFVMLAVLVTCSAIAASFWNVSAWSLLSDVGEDAGIEGQVVTNYMAISKMGSFFSFLVSSYIVAVWGTHMLIMGYGIVVFVGSWIAFPLLRERQK